MSDHSNDLTEGNIALQSSGRRFLLSLLRFTNHSASPEELLLRHTCLTCALIGSVDDATCLSSVLVVPLTCGHTDGKYFAIGGNRLLATTGGEAESPKTLECSTPVPREGKVLQSKVWDPELNGGQATALTMRSVFLSPPSLAASSVDTLQSNPRITYMPVAQKLTEVPYPTDVWKSARCKEGGSKRSSSWMEGLIEEDRVQNAATLKRQLSSSSTFSAETSALIHRTVSHSSRPGASNKEEPATPFKDVSLSESLSDSLDEEGGQVVSEKRRKRYDQ